MAGTALAQDNVAVRQVRDSRATGQSQHSFGSLHVDLGLKDAAWLQDVTQYRVLVSKAIDDLGSDLVNKTDPRASFYQPFRSAKRLHLRLVSPVRQATVIRELVGTIEFYAPQRDPSSRVTLDSFFKQTNAPIFSPQLAAVGVNLETPTVTMSPIAGDPALAIHLNYTDPNERVVGFEFIDPTDGALKPGAWSSSRRPGAIMRGFTFRKGLFDSTNVVVDLATPASVVKVAFTLYNVPLP